MDITMVNHVISHKKSRKDLIVCVNFQCNYEYRKNYIFSIELIINHLQLIYLYYIYTK